MEMSVDCLVWAREENLIRLARSLGVTLPPKVGIPMRWRRRWAYALIAAMDWQRATTAKERSDGQGGSGEGGGEDRGGDR